MQTPRTEEGGAGERGKYKQGAVVQEWSCANIYNQHRCPRLAYAHSVLTALGEVVLLAGQARVNFCFSLHLDQPYQAVCKLEILDSFIQEP